MNFVLIALVALPLLAVAASALLPSRFAGWATIAAGAVTFALTVVLVPGVDGQAVHAGFLRADALSMVFLLATSFLYLVVGIYAHGYLQGESDMEGFDRYGRLFFTGLNVFAWSMLCAPVMDGLALLWVAIEITTIVSALLVAIDDTDGATEAAWKYVLLASTGLGIALLATIFMYYAGAASLGRSYDLAFAPLLQHANELPHAPVKLAFVLAVVGFGTKVGLVPMHTWLPDAHAEAPTPVSALLSGALLSVSFYAVLRYFQVAEAGLGSAFPRHVLLVFGVASLLLAALYVLGQRDVKRLLAYSSVEHMGILAIGVSFGAPLAAAGVLLHVLAHAAAKGGSFMGAGVLMRAFDTKDLSRIRDALGRLPRTAPVFLALLLGLSGLPPFGIFRSELMIVAGGFTAREGWLAATLVLLVTVAFVGVVTSMTRVICAPAVDSASASEEPADTRAQAHALTGASQARTATSPPSRYGEGQPTMAPVAGGPDPEADRQAAETPHPDRTNRPDQPGHPGQLVHSLDNEVNVAAPWWSRRHAEPSTIMWVAMVLCLLGLLVLGLHPPHALVTLLDSAAHQLTGGGLG